ncbi:iron chelate uptake ABC transporter family permease subunit [Sphingomonas sp. LR61]|uniref:iron chelate uptake ABC transporter family permease subunit n=1 Tax=Sphingomonas sp. LR61 TaxID=3050234 RepID=UPI003FA68ECD
MRSCWCPIRGGGAGGERGDGCGGQRNGQGPGHSFEEEANDTIRLAIPNLMLTTRVSEAGPPGARCHPGKWAACSQCRRGRVLVIVVGAVLGLGIGTMPIAPADVVRAVLHPTGDATSIIVWQLRMPRTVLALLVGASIGGGGHHHASADTSTCWRNQACSA